MKIGTYFLIIFSIVALAIILIIESHQTSDVVHEHAIIVLGKPSTKKNEIVNLLYVYYGKEWALASSADPLFIKSSLSHGNRLILDLNGMDLQTYFNLFSLLAKDEVFIASIVAQKEDSELSNKNSIIAHAHYNSEEKSPAAIVDEMKALMKFRNSVKKYGEARDRMMLHGKNL